MDKGSLENKFKAMKMSELKKFLQDRGITVNSYLKPGLVAILEPAANVCRRVFMSSLAIYK